LYYDYMYEASPRPLTIEKYATGTVTTSGTTVTGSDMTFPTDCEGSIIRFGTSTYEPTSVVGGYDASGTWIDNRYAAQRKILGRTSGTVLTIDESLSTEVSAVKYTISDPIDIHTPAMFVAFQRLAEAEFARLVNHKQALQKEADALKEVRLAMEADQMHSYGSPVVVYDKFSHVTVSTSS
jgi:hypothetical protein